MVTVAPASDPDGGALKGRQTGGKQSDDHRARLGRPKRQGEPRSTRKSGGSSDNSGEVGTARKTREAKGLDWDKSRAHEASRRASSTAKLSSTAREAARCSAGSSSKTGSGGPPGNASPRQRAEPKVKEPLASIAKTAR